MELKLKYGTIRYFGKLVNNAKAGDDLWLGIEWDEEGTGKNNGTVDGHTYFVPYVNSSAERPSCSFLRYGKIKIGGIDIREAIIQKYQPNDTLTDEEKKVQWQKEQADLYVKTDKAGGMKKIEIYGFEQSYNQRADLKNARDIALEGMKISSLGNPGLLKEMIPNVMNLYLDKNMLYSWDQYFEIIKQLRYLRVVTLTGNKFQKIFKNYLMGKNIEQMIHTSIFELVLIDMGLDWEVIDALAPVLVYIEHLHLCQNYCSKIFTEFQLPKEHFKLLKFVNLEDNGIASWDEVDEFRKLKNLKRLTLNKNFIQRVYYKPGWPELYVLNIEDNPLDSYESIDQINEFPQIRQLRLQGSPLMTLAGDRSKEYIIARAQFVTQLNGMPYSENERRDCELFYMKQTFREFLKAHELQELKSLDDERLQAYVAKDHPRWFSLVEKFGSPLETVSLQKEGTSIQNSSAEVTLISEVEATQGKTLKKKLLLTMTVAALKSVCSKLFKIEALRVVLFYQEDGYDQDFPFDEDQRQLSFFTVRDGGRIIVRDRDTL